MKRLACVEVVIHKEALRCRQPLPNKPYCYPRYIARERAARLVAYLSNSIPFAGSSRLFDESGNDTNGINCACNCVGGRVIGRVGAEIEETAVLLGF